MTSDHPSSSRHRSSPSPITNHVSQDIWSEILKRLPVKTLVQLQLVCKSWNSLLSSSSFHSHHLNFPSTTNTTTYFNVHHNVDPASYTLDRYRPDHSTRLDFPLESHNLFTLLGVIHGVVCLSYSSLNPSKWPDSIALWNPTIRRFIDVSCPPKARLGHDCNFMGFGFDSSRNDFKLVWSPFLSKETGYYEVLSVHKGVWRRKKLPDNVHSLFNMDRKGCCCFLNGRIHWVTTTKESGYGLLVFECEREEFRTMDLPRDVHVEFGYRLRVFVHDGLIRVVRFPTKGQSEYCEVWTMKEYGDAITWSRDKTRDGYLMPNGVRLLGNSNAYVFEESMLLMDIAKPYDRVARINRVT